MQIFNTGKPTGKYKLSSDDEIDTPEMIIIPLNPDSVSDKKEHVGCKTASTVP